MLIQYNRKTKLNFQTEVSCFERFLYEKSLKALLTELDITFSIDISSQYQSICFIKKNVRLIIFGQFSILINNFLD